MVVNNIYRSIFLAYNVACLLLIHFVGVSNETTWILMKLFILLSFIDFMLALGHYVCFFELLIFMGSLQWFGSNIWLTENLPKISFRPVSHYYETFFTFTLILSVILLSYKPSKLEQLTQILIGRVSAMNNLERLGKVFFYTGLAFSFITGIVGNLPTIGQIFYLFAQLGYVSMICFIFSKSKEKFWYIGITLAFTLFNSIQTTLFWPIIFWSLFFFIIYSIQRKVTFFTKVAVLAIGIFMVILVQSFKQQLRFETAYRPAYLEQKSGNLTAFSDLASQRLSSLSSTASFQQVFMGSLFARMNQGVWDNVAVSRVDQRGAFLKGESIFKATAGAFIPRFIWPDKPKFDNSRLTSLLNIKLNAFISISVLAEAYVNFGFIGGAIFMCFYGLLLAGFYKLVIRWSFRKTPLFFVFFPFLFYTFMRAEVDFVQTIYSIVSSTVTLWLLFYMLNRFGLLSLKYNPSSQTFHEPGIA